MTESKILKREELHKLGMKSYDRYKFERCKDTYKGKGIYLVKFENGIKVGFSRNLKSRLSYYKHPWCRPIESIICYKCPNPERIESIIKIHYKLNIISNSHEFISGIKLESIIQFIESNIGFKESNLKLDFNYKNQIIERIVSTDTPITNWLVF